MQAQCAAACRALAPAAAAARRPAPSGRPAGALAPHLGVQQRAVVVAALGDKAGTGKTGIRREDEPEEYWTSQAERDGKSPFQDPLAQIGILAILFPFIFLAVAIAFGWVDLNGGR